MQETMEAPGTVDEGFSIKDLAVSWDVAAEAPDVVETKGRGRPKKSGGSQSNAATGSTPSINFGAGELKPLTKALANPLCRNGGVPELSDAENDELCEALAPVLSKYLGASLDRFGAEVALAGVALKIAAPRIVQARSNKAERAESDEEVGADVRDEF